MIVFSVSRKESSDSDCFFQYLEKEALIVIVFGAPKALADLSAGFFTAGRIHLPNFAPMADKSALRG